MSAAGDLAGRSFLVTGSNAGIGRATAIALARRGGAVTLACRSEERASPVVAEITAEGGRASFLELDLGRLASVERAAKRYLDSGARLDVLVNNAGILGHRGLTADGFELTFGTNHLGPFLLTLLLLPLLRESPAPRVVNVTSNTHHLARNIDWDALRRPTRSLTAFPEYFVSKLCNILFTSELARGRGAPAVPCYSVHPGIVGSEIFRWIRWPLTSLVKLFLLTTEEGARTSLHCATSPDVAAETGLYYAGCKPRKPSALAEDDTLASKLWDTSAEMVSRAGVLRV
jgi:retinol dehydrogenase-12